jgi:hypothetical protein
MEMIQLWIFICFQYLTLYLNRLGDAKKLQHHLEQRALQDKPETVQPEEADEAELDTTTTTLFPKTQLCRPVSLVVEDTELTCLPDTTRILLDSVTQTSYITTVFEANRFGLSKLTTDVMEELSLWFEKQGLLAIACEMVWNVPNDYRNRAVESQLKDNLHKYLRHNNRRVLDLKWKDKHLPLTFPDATTQETSGNEQKYESFQGVYRKFYGDLLPCQHKDTSKVHSPFWLLKKNELQPNPEQFLLGNNRKFKELSHTTLVALNLITLKVTKD